MLKIFFFSGGQPIFQITPRIKFLYDWVRKLGHLLVGETYFGDRADNFSKFIDQEATGAHFTGALGKGVS